MPHVKGKWEKPTIVLAPWQKFILGMVFGWVDAHQHRRFKTVYIEVARKNAKSTLCSAIALYVLACDDENGPDCYTAATTREQARIVFNDAKRMAEMSPEFRVQFGIDTSAHAVFRESTGGSLRSVSAEGSTLDGLNVHLAIIDELHAHKSRKVWDVLETATAARTQPLMFAITTAGSNRTGICYEQRDYVRKVLAGVVTDDEYFGMIFAVDDSDLDDRDKLLSDPAIWAKANPNLNVSVRVGDLERKARKARQQASAQNNFLTKHLNVWVNADTAWLPIQAWDKCADESLLIEDFAGQECVMGLDLASKRDIMAQVYTFQRVIDGQKHLYIFGDYYLPQDAVEESLNSQYEGWEIEGRLIVSPGSTNDFALLEERIKFAVNTYQMRDIPYDPSQATQLSTRMADENITMSEVTQSVANFSEPMKEIEAMVYDGRLHHNGCPIMSWAVSNVVCHVNAKDQIYPRKETADNKIDPVVALIMAVRKWIDGVEEPKENVYKSRGARTL
jgi:phage terminase large subunit-like protein